MNKKILTLGLSILLTMSLGFSTYASAETIYTREFHSTPQLTAARNVPQSALDRASEIVADVTISSTDEATVDNMVVDVVATVEVVSPNTDEFRVKSFANFSIDESPLYKAVVYAVGSYPGDEWDDSYSWNAYATVYFTETLFKWDFYGVDGGWDCSDYTVKISNKTVTYTGISSPKTVSGNTFLYSFTYPNVNRPTCTTNATLVRSGSSWNLKLTVKAP